ncbi:MAG: DASS family sodium-coupled anion symporter [Bacteroidota bacterium]
MSSEKILRILSGPILFAISISIEIDSLNPAAQSILASTLWVAAWWILEAVPLAVTALMPIILFPLSGGMNIGLTTKAYSSPIIFLFLGGFILALAMERWNLHERIALIVISKVGTKANQLILGFMLATALLSMWISNTATALMLVPIGIAVNNQFEKLNVQNGVDQSHTFGKVLVLAICYSASIGGTATFIGSPTNLIFINSAKDIFGEDVSFIDWLIFALPLSIVLLFLTWIFLTKVKFRIDDKSIPSVREEIHARLKKMGSLGYEEKIVLIVFSIVAVGWITRSFLIQRLVPNMNDAIIALMGAVVLFMIPSKSEEKQGIMTWDEMKNLPWGILILFAGGLSIAAGFKDSGLAEWLGQQFQVLNGIPTFVIILVIVASVNFLTEITSNVATAAVIMPVLASLSGAIGIHPFLLMMPASIAASYAFMLPVATPPNAVAFSSGFIKMPDMVKTGFWLNLISIVLLSIFTYLFLPLLLE